MCKVQMDQTAGGDKNKANFPARVNRRYRFNLSRLTGWEVDQAAADLRFVHTMRHALGYLSILLAAPVWQPRRYNHELSWMNRLQCFLLPLWSCKPSGHLRAST